MSNTSAPTMATEVEVDVDPDTAFRVFTDEFDQWWGNGPIDAWDSSRVTGRRLEAGVGGRLLELYPDGELELGRITAWQPGRHVAWRSEDVDIEVTFEAVAGGTRVRVSGRATGPAAGEAMAFVRMTPQWLPRHLDRRAAGRDRPELGPLHTVLRYRRPAATARWLVDAFGFTAPADLPTEEPTDPARSWIELRVGDGSAALFLWLLEERQVVSAGDHLPWVYVTDLDAHRARAVDAGAEILTPIEHHGFRWYTAGDVEGRQWLFAQAPPHLR